MIITTSSNAAGGLQYSTQIIVLLSFQILDNLSM